MVLNPSFLSETRFKELFNTWYINFIPRLGESLGMKLMYTFVHTVSPQTRKKTKFIHVRFTYMVYMAGNCSLTVSRCHAPSSMRLAAIDSKKLGRELR